MNSTCPLRQFYYAYPTLLCHPTAFLSLLLKAHNKSIHDKFLRECLDEHVIPPSLLPVRLRNKRDVPFGELQRVVLKHNIISTRAETKECFKQLAFHKQRFQQVVPPIWKENLFHFCYWKLRRECDILRNRLKRKLSILIKNSDWTKHSNSDFIINLSSKRLSENISTAVGYGISFA